MREPEWTNRREHDPGITLLALLAWLALGVYVVRRLAAELRAPATARRPLRDRDA